VADVTGEVTIAGLPVTAVNGRYVIATVERRRTTALGAIVAAVRDGRRLVSVRDATTQPALSKETRMLAAAAAAQSLGLPVTIGGTGARVVAVRSGSPAAGVLRPGDVILAAEGTPVIQAGPLADLVRRQPPGTGLRLSVERDGQAREVVVASRGGEIGITVETRDLTVELPFEVSFSGATAGGPDAGLAYALTIADMLSTVDLAQGRTVAAAGRLVDAEGHIGPTTDLATQAEAAAAAGAAVFVVPGPDADGARRDDLHVEGVDSLARALEALSTTV
jgi:PDZ domain-containing protein